MVHTSFSWRDSKKYSKRNKSNCEFAAWNKRHCGIVPVLWQKLLEDVLPTLWLSSWHGGWSIQRPIKAECVDSDTTQTLSHSDRSSGETVLGLPLPDYYRYTAAQHFGLHKSGAAIHLNESRYQKQSWLLFRPVRFACLHHMPKWFSILWLYFMSRNPISNWAEN